jgi:hypothetical protein
VAISEFRGIDGQDNGDRITAYPAKYPAKIMLL